MSPANRGAGTWRCKRQDRSWVSEWVMLAVSTRAGRAGGGRPLLRAQKVLRPAPTWLFPKKLAGSWAPPLSCCHMLPQHVQYPSRPVAV
jgi:hypothetical protein